MVKQWPIALKLSLGTEEHYQWKAWQNLPAHLQALFKRQLLPATTNGRQMSQTHVPLRFRPKNQWVSVLPWWLGVGHKHECFYFLSGPLPTSYTSRFTDASRWSKELRKYVGLIRFCLVTRILPRMLFCFWKGVGLRIPLYFGSSFIAHIVRCEAKRLRCLRLLLSSSKSLIKHFERPYEALSKSQQIPG